MHQFALCKIFHPHLRTSIKFTRLTCQGEPMKIGLNFKPSKSTCGNIGVISYLCVNKLLAWICQCLRITWYGLDCRKRKGIDKFFVEDQHDLIWDYNRNTCIELITISFNPKLYTNRCTSQSIWFIFFQCIY